MRAIDFWEFKVWRIGGGFTLYPYQFALGITFRYWPCIFAPAIRIHIGPFKFWAFISFGTHALQ